MKKNEPNYTLNDKLISLVAEITEIATHLEMRESAIDPLLRKKNRLKTIHSSLAIEQNTLTLQQVTDIIDGKRVFGPLKEIEEVKNAKAAYAILEKVDPYSLKDLLKVHGLMVGGLAAWRPQMAWVPVEEIVRDRQKAYYRAISVADRTGDACEFIEFMLVALRDALVAVKKSVGKGVVKSVVKILDLVAQYPEITRERLAQEVGLSVRGVEKNLAQLKADGRLRRIGGRKGGRWEVVK